MTSLSHTLCRHHLATKPTRGVAYHYDAVYHEQVTAYAQVLDAVDRHLLGADVDVNERTRLLELLWQGPPSEVAAMARLTARTAEDGDGLHAACDPYVLRNPGPDPGPVRTPR